jgi:hypothetical protein
MSQNSGEYTIQENILRIGDAPIVFEDNIKEVQEISGMLVLLTIKRDGYFPAENVFGVSLSEKKIKWRIANLKYETSDHCPFVGIKLYNNQLYLNNWCDIYLIVDPLTGSIVERSAPAKN